MKGMYMESISSLISDELRIRYDFYNYNHAVEILATAYPDEFAEVIAALESFEITVDDIVRAGGNESDIPPKFSAVLRPLGWEEIRITGDLTIHRYRRASPKKFSVEPYQSEIIEGFIDGHNVDYVKGRVALDVEWNSKDQTFDRDLFALRSFYECGTIGVGIIVTRSESLNSVFETLDVKAKYGASTTWMGKLLPRLDARRHGGCPILAIGINPVCVIDWGEI